jgi:NADH-quinone oxidoreductase subunit I
MLQDIKTALSNLFKEPQTINYPQSPIPKPKNYRGLIEYSEPDCIYCLKCQKACPPEAIIFESTDTPSNNEKNKKSLVYTYDSLLCIYCGECVRACPKPDEALWQSEKKPNVELKRGKS